VTDLSQSKDLQNLLGLGGDLVDTSDSSDNSQSWFVSNIVVTVSLSGLGVVSQSFGSIGVFGGVSSSFLDDFSSLDNAISLALGSSSSVSSSELCISRSLLGEALGDLGFYDFDDGHFLFLGAVI